MNGTVLCPCLSGLPFAHCCAPYAESPMQSGDLSLSAARASLRRHLLEMVRVATGMQELWFACLDNLNGALREAAETKTGRPLFLDHFLWDWFKKYSEARPIVRVARYFEPTDLRLANHLDAWSLAPWEPWAVMGHAGGLWQLRQLGSGREVEILRAFDHHTWKTGDGLLCRILHHAGHDFSGLHVVRFPGPSGVQRLESRWAQLARKHGLAPTTRLRPDIHNEIWLPLHQDLIEGILMPSENSPPKDDGFLDQAQPALGGASPREAAGHEFGRHKLAAWAKGLPESERRSVEDLLDL